MRRQGGDSRVRPLVAAHILEANFIRRDLAVGEADLEARWLARSRSGLRERLVEVQHHGLLPEQSRLRHATGGPTSHARSGGDACGAA